MENSRFSIKCFSILYFAVQTRMELFSSIYNIFMGHFIDKTFINISKLI